MKSCCTSLIIRSLIVFFIFSYDLIAQTNQTNYKLKGIVSDESTGKPLVGVTVLATSRKENKDLTGTTTDGKGFFTISSILKKEIRLKFSMVGYQTKVIDSVSLETTSVLSIIKLKATSIVMPEVVIKSLKPIIEYMSDRKVINIDMVPGGNGSVTDALKHSGVVDVDPVNSNITLRGQEVKLQIDGHPFNMPVNSLAQMPANMFDQVEVILAPGAKESAEGGAYILNLISKKNTLDTYNGSVNLSTSSDGRSFAGLNFNCNVKKVNFFSSFFGGLGNSTSINESQRTNYHSSNLYYQDISSINTSKGYGGTGKLGLDYNINENSTFTFYGTYSRQKGNSESKSYSFVNNIQGTPQYTYNDITNNDITYDNYSAYGFYNKKFESRGHELIIDALFTRLEYPTKSEMSTSYNYKPFNPYLLKNNAVVDANTFIFKTDYAFPTESGKLETGYNFTIRYRENDYKTRDYSYINSAWLDSMGLSNLFRYTENIHAIYTTYKHKVDKLEIKAGIRVENLSTHGEQFTTNKNFSENYLSLFPDLNISYKISEDFPVSFNTFRRVKYPQLYYVNPFKVYNSPNNYDEGNPKLKPFFLNSFSMNFSQFLNFYYVLSNGMFNSVSTNIQDSITVNSYINIGTNKTYGIELTLPYYNSPAMPVHLPDFVTLLNLRFEYLWRKQDGSFYTEDLTYTAKRFSLNASMGLNLWYDVNASLYFYYVPKTENKRSISNEVKYLSISLDKSVFDQKLRISLSVNDLLNLQNFDFVTNGSNYYSRTLLRMKNTRAVSLSFSYMFNDYEERRDRNLDDGRDNTGKNIY